MDTFVATLIEIKNIGGGIFAVKVNYSNAVRGQSVDRVYETRSDSYASSDEFIAFVRSEVAGLNAANAVLQDVSTMIGQRSA